jgi:flagellar biosynthesis protein
MKSRKAAAIRYDSKWPAPYVLAKGAGDTARRIVATAKEHDISVIEDTELVEDLYSIDIGGMIPEQLYGIMAEILVFTGKVSGNEKKN